jgi:hypothetical protein
MSLDTFLYIMKHHRPKQSLITHLLTYRALLDPAHAGAGRLTMK